MVPDEGEGSISFLHEGARIHPLEGAGVDRDEQPATVPIRFDAVAMIEADSEVLCPRHGERGAREVVPRGNFETVVSI